MSKEKLETYALKSIPKGAYVLKAHIERQYHMHNKRPYRLIITYLYNGEKYQTNIPAPRSDRF